MPTQTTIANLALLYLGDHTISDITDNSPHAIKIRSVFDHVFDEVMSLRDWKFAKSRCVLSRSATTPLYGYQYAYPLPSDFLRFVRQKGITIYAMTSTWGYPYGYPYPVQYPYDPPVYPVGVPYIVEALSPSLDADGNTIDGMTCLLTDYDNSAADLEINYIRRIKDYTLCTSAFATCVSLKLAALLAPSITNDDGKANTLEVKFREALSSAAALNESCDWMKDETGNTSWVDAGR